jgi:hypothetical protein
MATSFNGSLGQTNNYSSINELITKWPTAAQNQGIQLSGIAFDGGVTNYTNPTVISNLTLATNENPKSFLSYGSIAGIGVPSSYSGWFTDVNKIRAEINHNPNTNQSQVLKVKWADNQEITSATIGLSGLLPKTSLQWAIKAMKLVCCNSLRMGRRYRPAILRSLASTLRSLKNRSVCLQMQ